ncbi:MAG: hypothetical protein ABDH28_05650, partial [Brevinematia bacterium]
MIRTEKRIAKFLFSQAIENQKAVIYTIAMRSYMMYGIVLLTSLLLFLGLFSCAQGPVVEKTTVEVTQTNFVDQTNYVSPPSSFSDVTFSLVEISESALVQPYHLVEGVLEGGFSSNDVRNFYLYITNNGFSNSFQFYSLSNFVGIISAPGHSKIFVHLSLTSKLNSSYTVGL